MLKIFFTKKSIKHLPNQQFEIKKPKQTKSILAILFFLHILHMLNLKKASFNSNRDIRQNIAGDSGDGNGTQNNTPRHF